MGVDVNVGISVGVAVGVGVCGGIGVAVGAVDAEIMKLASDTLSGSVT